MEKVAWEKRNNLAVFIHIYERLAFNASTTSCCISIGWSEEVTLPDRHPECLPTCPALR